jgi:hypothetical protein
MRHDLEETQPNISNIADPEKPAADLHGMPPGSSIREHLVRETLSDLENQLTADHHLEDDRERDSETLPDLPGRADGR